MAQTPRDVASQLVKVSLSQFLFFCFSSLAVFALNTQPVGLVFSSVLLAVKLEQVWVVNNAAELIQPDRGLLKMADDCFL